MLGVASSHTPQLSTSAAHWSRHAARDERNSRLLGADGEFHTYDELLERADPAVRDQLGRDVWADKFDRAQAAVEELARRLAGARPDVVVIVGDDQNELFGAEGIPAIGLFTGDHLMDLPPDDAELAKIPEDIHAALWSHHAAEPDAYQVASTLSRHLAAALAGAEFDLTLMARQPDGRSLGHAFTFVRRRLRLAPEVPIVPILLNTYYPPNVPSPRRCWRLGQALRTGIESWAGAARVAVFASGGLSHFVVLEELDRKVLAGLAAGDGATFDGIAPRMMRSGTSETLNWITAGGALSELCLHLIDYVPAYRSPAGTGCGMAFASWGPDRRDEGATRR